MFEKFSKNGSMKHSYTFFILKHEQVDYWTVYFLSVFNHLSKLSFGLFITKGIPFPSGQNAAIGTKGLAFPKSS